MNEDRQSWYIERLEHKRRLINERLDEQRARVNARLDRQQADVEGKLNYKQERIIEAALDLLVLDGLANLSLRGIAKRLNMQAPALYWHFKNKEVLVDYMAEAILQKEFKDLEPRQGSQGWQEWLEHHMATLRKAMLAYPDGARVVAGAHMYPAVTLAKSYEVALTSLVSDGIDLQTARRVTMTATTYTFGFVIEEQSGPKKEDLVKFDVQDFMSNYPTLAKAVSYPLRTDQAAEEDYMAGLRYIIKGSTLS